MSGEMIVLRLLHVVCGVVWVGGVCMMHYVLLPATAQAGPGAGPVMAAIPQQRLFRLMPWIAVVSMLAGVRLLGIASGGFTTEMVGGGPSPRAKAIRLSLGVPPK